MYYSFFQQKITLRLNWGGIYVDENPYLGYNDLKDNEIDHVSP